MKIGMKFEGAREMERALAKLPRATARGVVRRVLKQVLEPVRDAADAYSPHFQIAVTSNLSRRQRALARSDFARNVVAMYVGPVAQDGSHAPHAHLIEFGTGPRHHRSGKYVGMVAPDPFMRPAWDQERGKMLEALGQAMWAEIQKTLDRRAAKAVREAAR